MNEYDSPNYTEFTYEKRAEGKMKLAKLLLILLYVAFVGAFFLVCYMTKLIPIFAVCPIFTWMLVFFTWRYVSFDIYYTFNHGDMEFGRVKVKKNGQSRHPSLKINVRTALLVAPFDEAEGTEEYKNASKHIDYSSYSSSLSRVVMVLPKGEKTIAIIFEGTARSAALISSYCKTARNLKNREYK